MYSWLAHCFPYGSKFFHYCVFTQQWGQSLACAKIDRLVAWLNRQRDGRYFNSIFCSNRLLLKVCTIESAVNTLLPVPWTLYLLISSWVSLSVTSSKSLSWSLLPNRVDRSVMYLYSILNCCIFTCIPHYHCCLFTCIPH